MADRDFAQLEATVKPEAGGVSGLRATMLVAGILLVVMMSFVGGYWLGSQQGHESAETAAKAKLLAQLQEQQKQLQALRRQADKAKSGDTVPTTEVGDLTFYTDLPKQPVKPQPLSQPASPQMPSPAAAASSAPAAVAASTPPATGSAKMMQAIIQRELKRKPATGPGLFYVQAASFQDTKAVAEMQRKLQAMDLNTAIRRVDIPGRGTWYRLLVGPYTSRDTADAARIDLGKKMHLKGIVIRAGG